MGLAKGNLDAPRCQLSWVIADLSAVYNSSESRTKAFEIGLQYVWHLTTNAVQLIHY